MKPKENDTHIALMGGTFDPIHHGHLIIANEVCELLKLDQLCFLPSAFPPHKTDHTITEVHHRAAMLQAAIDDHPKFIYSDFEVRKGGISYTIDTIRHFNENHPNSTIYFIIGTDSLLELHQWKEPEALVELCRLIVVERPGYDRLKVNSYWEDKVKFLQTSQIKISSTEIQKRVREGKSIQYLVPPSVERYIIENKLYVS